MTTRATSREHLGAYERRVNIRPASEITDRAKRYRAQQLVPGTKGKCIICGKRTNAPQVMHLSGDESDGEPRNLAWGCRSCNGKLSSRFIKIGSPIRTRQYNSSSGVPTYGQYVWAVQHHESKAHDEGGAIIHATPRYKRIEYARRIAEWKRGKRGEVPF
jgi:hypothetical protein